MSAEDEKMVLDEYATWTVTRPEHVDLSVDAFLAEREAEHNKRRIADALKGWTLEGMESAYIQIEKPTRFEQRAFTALLDVSRALVDDRPYALISSFTGKTERVFT